MVWIGAHTFAWSAGLTDREASWLFPRLEGTAVDFVEVASYDLVDLDPAHLQRLSRRHGLPLTLCSGLPAGLSLTSPDPAIRDQACDHIRRLLDFADACGALKLSGPIHRGMGDPLTGPSSPDDVQRLVESYSSLREEIAGFQRPFSVEPLNRYQSSLLNTLEQVQVLVEAIDLPNFGILADLFHANIEQGNLYRDLEQHRPTIRHAHLCGADRGPIGRCHLDWPRIGRWLASLGSDFLASIETFDPLNPLLATRTRSWRPHALPAEQIVLQGAAYLKQLLDDPLSARIRPDPP